jgi:hypothetical protein
MIEKRVLRKLDIRLVPMLFVLFLVSFVDKGNFQYPVLSRSLQVY